MSDNSPHLLKLKNDADLRNDGIICCSTLEQVVDLMLDGHKPSSIFFSGDEVEMFNSKVVQQREFNNGAVNQLSFDWQVPSFYKSIDVYSYVQVKLEQFTIGLPEKQKSKYFDRVLYELEYFEDSDSFDFLRCIIFIVETLSKSNIFWGVGRGSSCASLCLFLIGLHMVDPIKFDLPTEDFFK